eukprot:TRINITY_DN715_c0_g1_i1.p1 TRINITY_DN715_c0_g1~~TRINITY_DN715_c0_g1_i1.p1  ORF type:complete len:414 (+),score=52.81 TRINITY_DN715_c0_g1_i1:106-1242(+)
MHEVVHSQGIDAMVRDVGNACDGNVSRVSATQSSLLRRKPTYLEILMSASNHKTPPIDPRPDQAADPNMIAVSTASEIATTPDNSAWPPMASVEDSILHGNVDASGGYEKETSADDDDGLPVSRPQSNLSPESFDVDGKGNCEFDKNLSEEALPGTDVRSRVIELVNTSPSSSFSAKAKPDRTVELSSTGQSQGVASLCKQESSEQKPSAGRVSFALKDDWRASDEDRGSGDSACDVQSKALTSRRRRRRRKKRTGLTGCAMAPSADGSHRSSSGASLGNRTVITWEDLGGDVLLNRTGESYPLMTGVTVATGSCPQEALRSACVCRQVDIAFANSVVQSKIDPVLRSWLHASGLSSCESAEALAAHLREASYAAYED